MVRGRLGRLRSGAALLPAALVFLGLFAAPLAYFLVISFWSVRARVMRPDATPANYIATWTQYGDVLGRTLAIAGAIGLVTTAIAFCFAYAIRFKSGRFGDLLLFLTLVTLFGGYLVKIYAWKSILGRDGILNQALLALGLIDQPLDLLIYSVNAVVITLTYFLLPFAVLPIYGSLRALREATMESARDLGAGRFAVMRDIVLPQCEGGLVAAFTLSFRRRLRDAALRGRRRGDDGELHREPVFHRLQLAHGQRHVLHRARRLVAGDPRLPPPAAPDAPPMRAQRQIDLLWPGFSGLVLLFMILPIALVIVFSFNRSALTSLR